MGPYNKGSYNYKKINGKNANNILYISVLNWLEIFYNFKI